MKHFLILVCLISSQTINAAEIEQPLDKQQVKAKKQISQSFWTKLEKVINLKDAHKAAIPGVLLRSQRHFIKEYKETQPYAVNLVYALLSASYNPNLSYDFFRKFNKDHFMRLLQGDLFAIELHLFLEVASPKIQIGSISLSFVHTDKEVADDVIYLLENEHTRALKKIQHKWTIDRTVFIAKHVWKKFPEFSKQILLERGKRNEPKALFQLGKLLVKNKKSQEALPHFEKAASQGYQKAIRRLAQRHFKNDEHEMVIELLQPLVEQEDKKSCILLARSYMSVEKYDEARELLEKAQQQEDENGAVDYYFGILEETLGDKFRAYSFFKKSCEKGFKKAVSKLNPSIYRDVFTWKSPAFSPDGYNPLNPVNE